MSTWIMSAHGSTALTCSPSRAKSADRMEAASLAGGIPARILPFRSRADEAGHEHGVGAVPVGPQTGPGDRNPVGAGEPVRAEPWGLPQERVADGVGLRPREGADRVHEHPAHPKERGGADGQP